MVNSPPDRFYDHDGGDQRGARPQNDAFAADGRGRARRLRDRCTRIRRGCIIVVQVFLVYPLLRFLSSCRFASLSWLVRVSRPGGACCPVRRAD